MLYVLLLDLACLSGDDVIGSQSVPIAYCQQGERCFAGIHHHNDRPHPLTYVNYGCASQVVCDRLQTGALGAGSSGLCRKCCSEDGCNAHVCHSQVPENTTSVIATTLASTAFSDCWDLKTRGGFTQTAVYDIHPASTESSIRVRCDMTTDGGGWTVLQRRFDGSVNFTRTFTEYEEGFGNVAGEHWVGLEAIHALTSQGAVQVRVDLCAFFNGSAGYVVYSGFHVSGREDTYMLNTGEYAYGNIYESMSYHNGSVFQATGSCASQYRGGWWYRTCYRVNLNGGRYNGGYSQGIVWQYFFGRGNGPNMRSSEMKIRPISVPRDPAHQYTC